MKFTERKEFVYDPVMFARHDTQLALRINREWTVKHAAKYVVNGVYKFTQFFEVNRDQAKFDSLWHVSLDDRTKFSRVLEIPTINSFGKPDWRLTKLGLRPQRQDKFVCSNLVLQEVDYFPQRGDFVFFNGYRYEIVNVVLEPQAYWGQTGVWTGLVCECMIPAEGDARPSPNLSVATPAELAPIRSPLPEV